MRLACAVVMLLSAAVAPADDACLAALRATFRLHGGGQSSTAFAVAVPAEGDRAAAVLLVSAAHTFEKMKGETATAVLRAAAGADWERRDTPVAIRTGETPNWVRHPKADVAVLPWTVPGGVDLQPFPLGSVATEADFDAGRVAVGQRVRVACFPAQTEGNAAGWPVLRTGAIASHPLAPAAALDRLFLDYAHYGGDSGSAVVVDDPGAAGFVIGVVVAMQRQTDRVTSPFEEKTVHTPLGLAITVPSPLLHETIRRWRKPPAAEPERQAAAAGVPTGR
jgi:hypothetical protein